MSRLFYLIILVLPFLLLSCADDDPETSGISQGPQGPPTGNGNGQGEGNPGDGQNTDSGNDRQGEIATTHVLFETFGTSINLDNLPNYSNQSVPDYITKDNSPDNRITNAGALLGRVLFYDQNLSVNNTVSCSSCHRQQNAFSDRAQLSAGVAGLTGRHSMRLVNVIFANERQFFWDERAATLEAQTIQPIRDHVEMGFSGTDGAPDFNDLLDKLESIGYYQELFTFVYGDAEISAEKMQDALSQFIGSIYSFDSKYDEGRSQVNNDNNQFPNFNPSENRGKNLFMRNAQNGPNGRNGGGLGCNRCHRAPEFDIAPNSENNGLIAVAGHPGEVDLRVTRSPSLRDVFHPGGLLNSPLMHTGNFNINQMIDHYNNIPNDNRNNNLDNRLDRPGPGTQRLNMTQQERADLIAFLKTLSGRNLYIDEKFSDPF